MKVDELLVLGNGICHKDHAKFLLADLLNLNPLELLNHLEDEVKIEKQDLFQRELEALKEGRPLQYVIGSVNFYGNKIKVDKNVLIPRFETEELVEKTISYIKKYLTEDINILDLCTGSGAIGLTVKKIIPTSSVTISDISKEALEVAEYNMNNLNVDVEIINSDMFQNITKKYDVIISNPPYIKINEEIDEIVKNNEPHLALYAGEDGMDCYKEIFKSINNHLNDKAIIALEIGESQKDAVSELAHQYLENIMIICHKDLSGRDRMLFIFKNCV